MTILANEVIIAGPIGPASENISMAEYKKGLTTKMPFQCVECGFINKNCNQFRKYINPVIV